MLYFAILYYTLAYYTIPYYTILHYTILSYTILYYPILSYTILYYTVLYCTVLYYTTLYDFILYCTVLYCTVLYHTILFRYDTILYHTIPYFTYFNIPRNLQGIRYTYPRYATTKPVPPLHFPQDMTILSPCGGGSRRGGGDVDGTVLAMFTSVLTLSFMFSCHDIPWRYGYELPAFPPQDMDLHCL